MFGGRARGVHRDPCLLSHGRELGLIETTEPTGGTQHREYWGGLTNGQAAACRRRLATAPMDGSKALSRIARKAQTDRPGLLSLNRLYPCGVKKSKFSIDADGAETW